MGQAGLGALPSAGPRATFPNHHSLHPEACCLLLRRLPASWVSGLLWVLWQATVLLSLFPKSSMFPIERLSHREEMHLRLNLIKLLQQLRLDNDLTALPPKGHDVGTLQ